MKGKIFKGCLVFAGLMIDGSFSSPAQEGQKEYRSRLIGDKAFSDGYYSLAVKFYTQYKDEAAGDPAAVKDSYFCLFSACARNKDAKSARRNFEEFTAKFADDLSQNQEFRLRADYWNANILMLEGETGKAIETFLQIVKAAPDISDVYAESLSGLGMAYVRQLNWDEADKTYAKLESVGKGTKWADYARKQRVLVAVYKGDLEKARSMLGAGDPKNVADILLSIFLLTKDGKVAEAEETYRKTRNQAPQTGDSLWFNASMALANSYMEKKNFTQSLNYLKDAELFAETELDKEKLLVQIINANALSGNYPDAIESCQKFLKNYPDSANITAIKFQLAGICCMAKKYQDAVTIYKEMMDNPRTDVRMKISAAKEAGRIFIAEKLFSEAREKFNFIVASESDANRRYEARIQLAEILFLEKKYAEAAAEFAKIAEENRPSRENAIVRRASALFAMKDYAQCLQLLDSFIEEFPSGENSQSAMFMRAMTLLRMGKGHEALPVFADFASRFPKHPDAPRAIFETGNIEFNDGDYKGADANYAKVFETYPKDELAPNALYKRLYAHFLAGDEAAAEKDLAMLLKTYPDSPFTVKGLFWQADYYRDLKNFDKAEAILQDIAAKFKAVPQVAAESVYECAYIASKTGKKDKAVRYLDELSEKYPNESIVSEGFMLRGDILSEGGEFEKAIPFYVKAAERRPGSNLETACWGRLGDCYFSIAWKTSDGTNIMTSTEYFKKIIGKNNVPMNFREQAIYKLAKCEEAIGDKGGALARYREIIYGYQVGTEKGELRDTVWIVKAAQAASRLYLEKETPEAAEAAVSIYRKLVELNVEPKEDFNKIIREIREKYKLKE